MQSSICLAKGLFERQAGWFGNVWNSLYHRSTVGRSQYLGLKGDLDGDGCFDGGEDPDIDDDQVPNLSDKCPTTFTNAANDLNSDGCDDDDVFSALISSTTPIIVLIVVLAIAGFVIVKMRSGTNVNVIDSKDVGVNIDQSDNRGSIRK